MDSAQLSLNQYLMRGIMYKDINMVVDAINQGADVNFNYDTPLRTASSEGNIDIVMYLVQKGADIHIFCDMPMMLAILRGNIDITKYLISLGSNVHAKHNLVMRVAVAKGYLDFIKDFVISKSDIEKFSGNVANQNILEIANRTRCENSEEVQKYLLSLR